MQDKTKRDILLDKHKKFVKHQMSLSDNAKANYIQYPTMSATAAGGSTLVETFMCDNRNSGGALNVGGSGLREIRTYGGKNISLEAKSLYDICDIVDM